MKLKDNAIIVTGGTSGIGAAIARKIVVEGGKVLIHGRDKSDGEKVVAELGENAVLCIIDLEDPSAPEVIANACVSAFGKIDGLVNNAANLSRANLDELTPERFDSYIAVNIKAPLFLIKACHSELKKTRGSVLNIGSTNAYAGETSLIGYSVSKGALATMTRNLANAHGIHGIRINQINPGWILTDNERELQISRGGSKDWFDHLTREQIPFGKMSTPEDVAAASIYWLSDDSKTFSGTILELEQFSVIGRNPEKL
jgi:NAD(P)-dependent dehydrogenase (short-subunit alcohol dehydrogenase family)